MQRTQHFNFHPRCEKLCITNISFTDDLIMLTGGDAILVNIMMKIFKDFTQATGLKAHPANGKGILRECIKQSNNEFWTQQVLWKENFLLNIRCPTGE